MLTSNCNAVTLFLIIINVTFISKKILCTFVTILSEMTIKIYGILGIAIAAACQFGFMPFIAFIMAKIFALDKVAALAVLVTGCCPGGNLSNLLTYFLYGDMNLRCCNNNFFFCSLHCTTIWCLFVTPILAICVQAAVFF